MKTIEGVKITSAAEYCLLDAVRRYKLFAARDGRSIETAWLGLGSPSAYRDVVRAGVMVPACGPEGAGRDNWYKLTALGVKVLAAWQALGGAA